MIRIPPYLQPGDTIALVAPAGYMPHEKIETCIQTLESWGYKVLQGDTVNSQSTNYFSGTDAERLYDLQRFMDDKHVNAILCVRGGYGISRIVDDLNFKKFVKHPKWIIGFSDVTVLHAHIFANYKIATLHSPMAAAFNEEGYLSPYVASLKKAITGEPTVYHCEPHELNREGHAKGVLVGGNLCLLAHLIGTPSDINTKHKILFLEDVGEYLYSIDRLLTQLKRAGKFDKLEGLIIGGFTDCKDTVRPFGKSIEELIYEQVKEFEFPVCFGFPVSHAAENYALKVGVEYELTINPDVVSLKE